MEINITAKDYVIEVHDDLQAIDGSAWNALLFEQSSPSPFMRHEYLSALHLSDSATAQTGWAPKFFSARLQGKLVGACALYLKSHSYGEYVFDWAWADAYQRHGMSYYPKLLGAVPFTPVPGSRLLATDGHSRASLVEAIGQYTFQNQISSAHILFVDEVDRLALEDAGWMLRQGVQFHWLQDNENPCLNFAELLSRLQRDKRKKIQQERRRVTEAGVTFTTFEGSDITAALWDFFYHCYTRTYHAHHSTPYLTRDFFARMAVTMPEHWVLFVANQNDAPIAASLIAIDRSHAAAWGRYWGATCHIPCLHFEACYYQPLQWCLANGIARFEGGAQGEHKMSRGLLPVPTHSAHWLQDQRFAGAVGRFLAAESEGIDHYLDELHERSPFKMAP